LYLAVKEKLTKSDTKWEIDLRGLVRK
jgi:hypothetical protein